MNKDEKEAVDEIFLIVNSLILIIEKLEETISFAQTLGYVGADDMAKLLQRLKNIGITIHKEE